eukprot:CAMPEP_0198732002 /NCGR_PEP_ID=MMETSP1475-20131203/33266_1 /TAXON_ID= ORGANISM="Unidentified sp., Strain CCMP1999" /NCGR_SAMPLE_ID=MMETSP1475 /ASSEMBLY_ACC=CAM_ASM_001111 /LENGTH=241 /DNA_ID=CAMNT_0044495033 /DNA_START=17 /DNA_END=742 /DNA_ORIENTATION=-
METVAFTHAHMDHIGGIGMHIATRSMRKMTPPTYLVPEEIREDVDGLIRAFAKLDGSQWRYTLKSLPPDGKATHLLGKGRLLRTFQTYHTVPSQGYLLYSEKKKLLDEYSSLSSKEISELRRQGVEVSRPFLTPEIAVPGDTTIDVLEAEQDVRRAALLVLEITFIDNASSVQDARRFGHIHLDEVVEKAHLFQNKAVLFTHFSARYSEDEISEALDKRLPPELRSKALALTFNHKSPDKS